MEIDNTLKQESNNKSNGIIKDKSEKSDDSKMVILVFKSGKIIFTGGKSEVEIQNSLELLQI